MPGQGPNWTEFLSCAVCCRIYSENTNRPISLGCGHTVCKQCLSQLQQSRCPFDQSPINCDIDKLPVNYALLQLIGAAIPDKVIDEEQTVGDISDAKKTECYESARKCIEELAVYLKPLSEDSINELEKNNENLADLKINKQGYQQPFIQARNGRTVSTPPLQNAGCVLSRPMQRKLLGLINCQLVEEEGRSRAVRAARSLGERSVTELILAHQNPQQLSANLWSMVRTRGCQFLGPGMQEEVLRLILLALEDGSALSRKVLVLFVVQKLEKQYPQASKTAIGHVVQLLYRASCFKVTKREEESSLMQLKEEFRTYDALRQEHDAQIVEIAMEAGLRISPEQWSSLLYGDALHKSHMQSIIDKHQSPQSFSQGINELVLVLQRLGDPCNLCRLRLHLEFLAKIDPSPDCPAPPWDDLEVVMKSLKIVVQGLVDFVKRFNHRRPEMAPPQNTRYKTSMCRDFTAKGSCPRGATCTFAHSQEELEQYRCRSKKLNQKGGIGGLPLTAFTSKQGAETLQPGDSDQQSVLGTTSHNSMEAGESDDGVPVLLSSLAGLSVRPAVPSPTHPESGQAVELSQWPLGAATAQQTQCPPAMFSVQPGMPMGLPAVRMAFGSTPQNVPEGLRAEQQPAAFPKGMGVRFQPPADCQVPYHNSALGSNLSQSLSPANLTQLTTSNLPQPLPPANLQPPQLPPGAPANLPPVNRPQLPPPGVLPAMVPQAAPSCLHRQVPGEVLASVAGSVYPMGQVVPGVMPPPPFPPVYGQGPDVQAAMAGSVPISPMQTLEKLQNRKSKLISCLQSERSGPRDVSVAGSEFDRVLMSLQQLSTSPLTSSVSDSLVATRTTNTLDVLEPGNRNLYQVYADHLKANSIYAGPPPKMPTHQGAAGMDADSIRYGSHQTHYQNCDQSPRYHKPIGMQASSKGSNKSAESNTSLTDVTDEEQGSTCKEMMTRLPRTLLDEDDEYFIPFDPPLVSKFGPISRCARIKSRNTAPVQVTAADCSMQCTPVLSNTPLCHPFPARAPDLSSFKPQINASVVMPTNLPPPAPAMYSPWSGLDFWRWRNIPEMVHQLETSAIQAPTTSERLTLQLQSVELQISLKTGENPKHVCQLLQEAKPGEGDHRDSLKSPEKPNISQQDWVAT